MFAIIVVAASVLLWLRPRQMHEPGGDTEQRPVPPDHVRNVALWEEDCRRIHARAGDLIEGRLGIIEAARTLWSLAHYTGLESDTDLATFEMILTATVLPIDADRSRCAPELAEQLDAEIARIERHFRDSALASAESLARRFEWALEARNERRRSGGQSAYRSP